MFVITGATGNIGSKIAEILLSQGQKVRVVGRNAGKLQGFVGKGAEAAVGDLKDSTFLTGAFSGATAAFAMIPPDYTAGDFREYQNEVGASIAAAIRNVGHPLRGEPEQPGRRTSRPYRPHQGAA